MIWMGFYRTTRGSFRCVPPTCVLGATHTSLTSELPVAGCLAGGAASQKAPPVLLEELRQCHEKSCARAAPPEGRSGGGGEEGEGLPSASIPFQFRIQHSVGSLYNGDNSVRRKTFPKAARCLNLICFN